MWIENIYKRMVEDFFVPAFRTVSMTRCVSISRYYDTVHDYKHHADIESGDYVRAEMSQKNYKHLRLIMGRLSKTVNEEAEGLGTDALFRPTVFEGKLPKLMVDEYNRVAASVGATLAPDGYYHCMLDDKRSWINPESSDTRVFAFSEHVAIACLDCVLSYSAIGNLNEQISEGQMRRVRGRFKKIKEVLNSPVFYNAIVKTFFDLVLERHETHYKSIEELFLKLERKIDKRKEKRYYHDRTDVELNVAETRQFVDNVDYLYVGGIFFDCVCPLAEAMLEKKVPMDLIEDADDDLQRWAREEDYEAAKETVSENFILKKNKVSVEEYVISRKIAKIVAEYINSVLDDTIALLECLPEAQIVGRGAFQTWYKKLKA